MARLLCQIANITVHYLTKAAVLASPKMIPKKYRLLYHEKALLVKVFTLRVRMIVPTKHFARRVYLVKLSPYRQIRNERSGFE